MKSGLVSVVTPMYNSEKFVEYTIKSVLGQTYENWEMIIVDDGSKDLSADIVSKYCSIDKRIQLIRQKNSGSASARNNGIRVASGQYITLLDSDDLWDSNFLEEQIALMKKTNSIVVCSSYRKINTDGKEILRPTLVKERVTVKDMQRTNYIACLTGVYDISKHGKIFLKEELKSIRDDYAYWLDVVKLQGFAYGNRNVLASYRVMQNSTTGKKHKLIKSQFNFYYNYQKLSLIRSVYNTIYWAFRGFLNLK